MNYIYVIQYKNTLKIYVGQTNNPKNRWAQHKSYAKNGKLKQYIHRAMAKYGIDNFVFKIIDQHESQEMIDKLEDDWINWFKSRNNEYGYNIAPGGNIPKWKGLPKEQHPMYGKHHSEETKKVISIKNTGIKKPPHTEEWKRQASERMIGHTISEETRIKIVNSNKGQIRSTEIRKNISKAQKGRITSDNTKKKMSIAQKEVRNKGKSNAKLT